MATHLCWQSRIILSTIWCSSLPLTTSMCVQLILFSFSTPVSEFVNQLQTMLLFFAVMQSLWNQLKLFNFPHVLCELFCFSQAATVCTVFAVTEATQVGWPNTNSIEAQSKHFVCFKHCLQLLTGWGTSLRVWNAVKHGQLSSQKQLWRIQLLQRIS